VLTSLYKVIEPIDGKHVCELKTGSLTLKQARTLSLFQA